MRGAWCLPLITHALKPPALDRRAILGAYASLASLPANAAALRQAELETIQLFEKATKSVVFIDTFVDHDRGYYPRHGLLDRRSNPRLGHRVHTAL